jgi:hypothetical protein
MPKKDVKKTKNNTRDIIRDDIREEQDVVMTNNHLRVNEGNLNLSNTKVKQVIFTETPKKTLNRKFNL